MADLQGIVRALIEGERASRRQAAENHRLYAAMYAAESISHAAVDNYKAAAECCVESAKHASWAQRHASMADDLDDPDGDA